MRVREIAMQAGSEWREKILWSGGVGALLTVVYRALQAQAWRPVTMRTDCAGWRWLPFEEAWIWPYLSMFALVGVAWWSLPDRRAVRRFAAGVVSVAAIGWVFFALWPTGCARPAIADPGPAYRWLVSVDGPTNCFPCLHAAFSVMAADAVARSWRLARAGKILLWGWVALIAVSIIAVRQHTDLDTLAGLALGGAGAWWLRRGTANG